MVFIRTHHSTLPHVLLIGLFSDIPSLHAFTLLGKSANDVC